MTTSTFGRMAKNAYEPDACLGRARSRSSVLRAVHQGTLKRNIPRDDQHIVIRGLGTVGPRHSTLQQNGKK